MENRVVIFSAARCASIFGFIALGACGPTGGHGLTVPTAQDLPGSGASPTGPMTSPRLGSAPNISICPGAATVAGTDVSDGDTNIQWGTVQAAGNDFAFIKATEGITFVNPDFATDWSNAKAAGVLRSAYHFFRPADNPIQAAQAFLVAVGKLDTDDLAPMLDWEVTDNVDNATQIQNAQAWLDFVEAATGKTPIIYVDPSFYNALGNPAQFARYPLYIANYLVNCPTVPPPWSNWTFWQTGVGTVTGVSSQADMDVFNGTGLQLTTFANTGSM